MDQHYYYGTTCTEKVAHKIPADITIQTKLHDTGLITKRFCRCPDPGVRIPTSNAACFLVPDVDARGDTVTHGFILVPTTGLYVQQRGCARALYYLAPEVPIVGGTGVAREGGKLPGLC